MSLHTDDPARTAEPAEHLRGRHAAVDPERIAAFVLQEDLVTTMARRGLLVAVPEPHGDDQPDQVAPNEDRPVSLGPETGTGDLRAAERVLGPDVAARLAEMRRQPSLEAAKADLTWVLDWIGDVCAAADRYAAGAAEAALEAARVETEIARKAEARRLAGVGWRERVNAPYPEPGPGLRVRWRGRDHGLPLSGGMALTLVLVAVIVVVAAVWA